MRDEKLRQTKVLVVDDNEHTLDMVKRILRGVGIRQVATAQGALEALKELRSNPADVMITDLVMDPVDGLMLVNLIRTADDSPNRQLPIIMLTGYLDAENEAEARKVGVNAFLSKPISAQTLREQIASVLASRAMQWTAGGEPKSGRD